MEILDMTAEGDVTSGRPESYWLQSSARKKYSGQLSQNIHADVAVIGGGIAGISVAYCLTKSGKKVAVIEDGYIGSGETGRTTAQLVTALDDRYHELEKIYGAENTKLIAESHKEAIDLVEKICRDENIDCGFRRVNGYLFRHPSDKKGSLKKECIAATRAGIEVHDLKTIPGILQHDKQCLEFPQQAQFHPVRYLEGLCEVILQNGGQIYTHTHAAEINHTGITTGEGFRVNANHIVVATNTPVNNLVAMHLKQTAFRTYVIAGLVKKNSVPFSLWWDTGDFKEDKNFPPYHYARLEEYNDEYDLLLSGGEAHPKGDIHKDSIQEENRYKRLEDWTTQHFPVEQILYRWSGQVIEPVDSLAYIGRNPLDKENVYIVTGDSGTGMTHGTLAGMIIPDLIKGKRNRWEEIYKPSRITVKTGNVFFKELGRGLMALLRGAPDDDRVKDVSQIQKGEGKVTNIEGHPWGVYKDENDVFHIVSAKCTHLKSTLTWNSDEKTWDCPWHGSRYTYEGHVVNGPANVNLPSYTDAEVEN